MVNVIANEIEAALARLGKTQSWLAEEVGVSNASVTKWMDTGEISRENAIKVAKVLGISLDRLLTGAPTAGEELYNAIRDLPDDSPQLVLDFIRYRVERAEQFLINEPDKRSHYLRMLDRFKADMEHRTAEGDEPDKPEKGGKS